MNLQIFHPKINEAIFFDAHVLIWIKSGRGIIEVDFKNYTDFENKLIFLSPGQWIKFLPGEYEVAKLDFPQNSVSQSREFRVLFKHLISLGYIDFEQENSEILQNLLGGDPFNILDLSTEQWYWQNPFNAKREEYSIIFDVKDIVDEHFHEHLKIDQILSSIPTDRYQLHRIFKSRLGLSLKNLSQNKLLLESQKDVAFTDKPIKEIAYDMGFRDPAYFNRFFKQKTQLSPGEFRQHFSPDQRDHFIEDLLELIRNHHKEQHLTAFYADKQAISIKALSRKVKEKLNMSVGQLIRTELIRSAKLMLMELPVKEVAYALGFEEANHFSSFFKKYAGMPPTAFQQKKSKY
ncbi:MAG: AraC family transcriptional regulator [Bacteroidia bacterium]|nr:AraC family transcriptional regulator [Bacteroidia bacterium]